MRTNKNFTILLTLVLESLLLVRASNESVNDTIQRENSTFTSNATLSFNRSTGKANGSFAETKTDKLGTSGIWDHKISSARSTAVLKPSSKSNKQPSLGDAGEFEVDLNVAEGMEHMHIMKKKPKYKKVKMEVLEPKIKYKKIKMKYKKPVKKMKKKKIKGYIKTKKMKMKKMKSYDHHGH